MTYTDLGIEYAYISGGVTYILNGTNTITTPLGSESFTFSYLGDQGFGLAPVRRITTRGPLQNGDSDIDFRLEPRVLQLPLMVKNEPSAGRKSRHYSIRHALLQVFNPRVPGVLRVRILTFFGTTSTSQNYYINVQVLGGLSFDVDPDNYHVRTVVQLRADDPTWYGDNGLGTGAPVTALYPSTQFGTGSITITAAGNWTAFPIIRVTGPVDLSKIRNATTNQDINFFIIFASIAAGEYYDIDLSYGKKTVINNLGVNKISTVSSLSALATWGLAPGSNVIEIVGVNVTTATNAVFSYFPRYTGI